MESREVRSHEYTAELKDRRHVINTSPKTIRFSGGTAFSYNKNRPFSKTISSHLEIFGKHNSKELNKKSKISSTKILKQRSLKTNQQRLCDEINERDYQLNGCQRNPKRSLFVYVECYIQK